MAINFAEVIREYRTRCERLLQNAEPNSAEYTAYSEILQAFDQYQTGEPGNRAFDISTALGGKAVGMKPVYGAPVGVRVTIAKAREIVEKWTQDFRHDTGLSGISYNYRLI